MRIGADIVGRGGAGLAPLDARLVHAQHDLTIHKGMHFGGPLFVSGKVVAAVQRRPGVLVVFRFTTHGEKADLVTTTDFSALYRDVKLEGGDRSIAQTEDPPKHEKPLKAVGDIAVAATAAHVYTECARIFNPIHTDVAYARAAGLPGIMPSTLSVHASQGDDEIAFETRNARGDPVIERGRIG
jgi:hypothetical protein